MYWNFLQTFFMPRMSCAYLQNFNPYGQWLTSGNQSFYLQNYAYPVKFEQSQILLKSTTSQKVKEVLKAQNLSQVENQNQSKSIKQQDNIQDQNKKIIKKSQKKNTQTNLINQIFSFLFLSEKSFTFVSKLLKDNPKKIKIFYAYMKTLKLGKPKYLNKQYLFGLVFLPEGKPISKNVTRSVKRIKILPVEEFRMTLYKLVTFFLRSQGPLNIISSKKMSKDTLIIHLQKRRQLLQYIESKSQLLYNNKIYQIDEQLD